MVESANPVETAWEQLTDAAFRALADGFPENCALRDLALANGPPQDGTPRADTQNRETERTTTDELL